MSCQGCFSRMRSKGSITLGVWGLSECVFARRCVYNRNGSKGFATVRSRPQVSVSGPHGRAYPKFYNGVTLGSLKPRVAPFRMAGVALRDIQACFVIRRKSFCWARAILLGRSQKMCCIFRGRRSTFATSIVISRGRRNTLDVLCCVLFCESYCQGYKAQILWQAWHFLRCDEN